MSEMINVDISRCGVYYNLEKSPFVFTTPEGDFLRFSSQKKLDIFQREIQRRYKRIDKFMKLNTIKDTTCVKALMREWSCIGLYLFMNQEV